ncbi:MAG TPA: CDP-alcohol phosphatidyltransferase family protein [Candidatus Saccharimonadales bacterium]|nr:CDP-alcohol phosphatidyltransferase family protein [Candidatus Saccharimonadales bacterium]
MHFTKARLQEVYWQSCRHEGFLNIYIYRRISMRIAVVAAKLGISPNQISTGSLVFNIASALMFVPGDSAMSLWALAPFHIGKVLDCADGQLAHLANKQSALGAFLDPFFDRVSDILILLALAIGYHFSNDADIALYLLLALVAAWFLAAYMDNYAKTQHTALSTLRRAKERATNPLITRLLKWDGGFTGLITTVAVVFRQIPALIAFFLLFAILPLPMQFKGIYIRLREEQA